MTDDVNATRRGASPVAQSHDEFTRGPGCRVSWGCAKHSVEAHLEPSEEGRNGQRVMRKGSLTLMGVCAPHPTMPMTDNSGPSLPDLPVCFRSISVTILFMLLDYVTDLT